MFTSRLLVFILGSLLLGTAWASAQVGVPEIGAPQQIVDQFLYANPGTALYMNAERVVKVYGHSFSHGASPVESATDFLQANAGMFSVQADALVLGGPNSPEGRVLQQIMYNPAINDYKFIGVNYSQVYDGIPVFRARAILLVRNEPGFPLVLVSANLRNLGGFQFDQNLPVNPQVVQHAAAGLEILGDPELVIWAGVEDMVVNPRLAIQFLAQSGSPLRPDTYQKWLFVVDAATEAILYQEDQILDVDVVGNVSGMATQGIGADICEEEKVVAMPWAKVSIQGGATAFADENGDFVIPNAGGEAVTVNSPVEGLYFEVNNLAGPNTVLSMNVVPPGPANFIHNEANNSEFLRAEINSYVEAHAVRGMVLQANPTYPGVSTDTGFTINVNISSSCNAFYDGTSINFYRALGNCSNTANSTIVHHEYGHHVVANSGSGQGTYGQGMSDCMGVLVTDQPLLAVGFTNDCDQALRNADNNIQYPCGGGCVELLSGCVWETRNELLLTNPSSYRDIVSTLTINSVLLHLGSGVTPQITIDFLTLDDNDGDIFNGTPHCQEIQDGFGAHNMAAPDVDCPDFVPGDLNGDGVVSTADLLILLSSWGLCDNCDDCPADLDDNCDVGASDLLLLLSNWG